MPVKGGQKDEETSRKGGTVMVEIRLDIHESASSPHTNMRYNLLAQNSN